MESMGPCSIGKQSVCKRVAVFLAESAVSSRLGALVGLALCGNVSRFKTVDSFNMI